MNKKSIISKYVDKLPPSLRPYVYLAIIPFMFIFYAILDPEISGSIKEKIEGSLWASFILSIMILISAAAIKRHDKRIEEELKRWIVQDKNKITKEKVFDKNIITEYNLPKRLSPVEAWFLYDMQIWKEDIVCLIYKWAEMWIISLASTKWWIKIIKNWDIKKWKVPHYEHDFWELLFKKWQIIKFPNEWILKELNVIKRWIELYCAKKWWIYRKNVFSIVGNLNNLSKENKFIPWGRLIWISISVIAIITWLIMLFVLSDENIAPITQKIGIFFAAAFPIFELILFCQLISIDQTSNKHAIWLTEEGKDLVRKIRWYKKFLESCEEKQLKQFMKQDPLYIDKILPYAVALGLENIVSSKIPQKILDDKTKNIFLLEKVI